MHVDIKEKDILIIGDGVTQVLYGTLFIAEGKYSINFTQSNRNFCLGLYYNMSNSLLFVNATKMYQFKTKYSEIKNIYCV